MANLQSLPILLKVLRLSAMANAWQKTGRKAVNEQWQPEEYLAELCELEAHQLHESRLKHCSRTVSCPRGNSYHNKILAKLPVSASSR